MPRACFPWVLLSAGWLYFTKGGLALAATSSYPYALKEGSNYSHSFGEGERRGHNKKACIPVARSAFSARCLPATFGRDLNLRCCLK